MPTVAEQMAERRERILEAAREIIAVQGFEGLTVRALAEAARVTVPTIYNLIGSKDQVLLATVAEQTERWVRGIERAGGDVVPIIDANNRELLRRPRYYRSLLRLMRTSKDAAPAARSVERVLRDQIRGALGELAEQGGIERWVDLDALTTELVHSLRNSNVAWAEGRIPSRRFPMRQRYAAALILLGVSRGAARRDFEILARESQSSDARTSGGHRGATS